MSYNFSRQTIEAAIDWYRREGVTLTEVAGHLGCSVNTVRSLFKQEGVKIRASGRRPGTNRPPSERVQGYIDSYRRGNKVSAIARDFGVKRQAVHSALKYHGVLGEKKDAQEEEPGS